ncbi:hypothetical protein [Kiloniella sp.]|uniref:hypothetical protein n=1 Tax=Kiloniella sp. TaxID=1938587 RepID=UPI003B016576
MKFKFKSALCVICLSFMSAAMMSTAFSASNQHIKLEGIEGESEDCALTNSPKSTKNTTGTIKASRNSSATQKKLINQQKSRYCK